MLEAQIDFSVRGQRYIVFEHDYYKELLEPHNDIFIKLFNTSAAEFIDGFDRLQYSRLFAFVRKKRYRVINEKSFGTILRIRPKD